MLEAAFLQDIVNNPDDETVRLIYADWLTEQGNPRGEFIRIQMQLAHWAADSTDWAEWALTARNLSKLRKREEELLKEHGAAWAAPLAGAGKWEFRRGFVEMVELTARQFVERGEEYFRLTPLREVVFVWDQLPLVDLARCPLLERLPAVTFNYSVSNDSLAAFLSSSHLTQLSQLALTNGWIGDQGLRALAEWPGFARLESLTLWSGQNILAGVRALLESPHWGRLRHFDIRGSRVTRPQLQNLSEELGPSATAWRLQTIVLGIGAWNWPARDRVQQSICAPVGGRSEQWGRGHTGKGPVVLATQTASGGGGDAWTAW
jgi:uncharacterized protein (TIGR02996 family)